VTTSVNPKQSTGQPAGWRACGLFSFPCCGPVAREARWCQRKTRTKIAKCGSL